MGVRQWSSKLKFSKHSHVIYRQKAFLMLISDFQFILPDFYIWAQGSGESGGQPGVAQIEVLQT